MTGKVPFSTRITTAQPARMGASPKALILSPLLNLPARGGGAPTIVQRVRLRSWAGVELPSEATLSLSPDGGIVAVKVDHRGGKEILDVRLRRLGGVAGKSERAADQELVVLELIQHRATSASRPFQAEISLQQASLCPFLAAGDHLPLRVSVIEGMRPGAILDINPHVPTIASEAHPQMPLAGVRDLQYFQGRLTGELAAAATAKLAVATSRHVELATHYARKVRALTCLGAQVASVAAGAA